MMAVVLPNTFETLVAELAKVANDATPAPKAKPKRVHPRKSDRKSPSETPFRDGRGFIRYQAYADPALEAHVEAGAKPGESRTERVCRMLREHRDQLRLPAEMAARIDALRGGLSREAFVDQLLVLAERVR